ncbi:hypothetical protein phiLo_95 [Thermus phage phiLo]|nr:hypothetical protein phiLo_95 [Thermus phage phiLo]
MVDGSKRYYYGFVRIDYSSGIGGMGLIGGPVAVGYDSPFGGPGIMAHELGHNFGRLHAPCGGAQDVDQNYPYDGGKTGVWGYDLQYGTLVSPEEANIMGYCGYRFVSDYNYYGAWHFLDKNPPQDDKGFQNMELREERVLISGWIDIEGEVHFNPTLVVRAKPEGKKSADYKIILDGSEEYPVYVLEDSEGGVHFRSIVPLVSGEMFPLHFVEGK